MLEQARKIAVEEVAMKNELVSMFLDAQITFKDAFDEYLALKEPRLSFSSKKRIKTLKTKYLCTLYDLPLANIKRKDILKALDYLIVNDLQELFNSVRSLLSTFYGWAVQKEYCEHNIARDIKPKYFFTKRNVEHFAHFSDLEELLEFKDKVSNCGSNYGVKLAFLFQLYTAVRPSEARLATWDEIDLEKGIWRISASRMKMRKEHEVVLSKQLIKVLKELKEITEPKDYCFKNTKKQPFSKETLLAMIQYIGYQYKINLHGLRGTFATIANELKDEHGFNNDIVQACLAHETQNQVAKAYNHAEYKKQRAKLLQWWADKLGDIDLKVLRDTSRFYL